MSSKLIGIIGFGGLAREIGCRLKHKFNYFVLDNLYTKFCDNKLVYPMYKFNPNMYKALVAVGDPKIRFNIVNKELPKETKYYTFIDETVKVLDQNIKIEEGSIICANSILTTNVTIGKYSILGVGSIVSHNSRIGDYCTISPGVTIPGNIKLGNRILVGINSSIREKTQICDDVTIGMGTVVTKNITVPGTYVGIPAKLIK